MSASGCPVPVKSNQPDVIKSLIFKMTFWIVLFHIMPTQRCVSVCILLVCAPLINVNFLGANGCAFNELGDLEADAWWPRYSRRSGRPGRSLSGSSGAASPIQGPRSAAWTWAWVLSTCAHTHVHTHWAREIKHLLLALSTSSVDHPTALACYCSMVLTEWAAFLEVLR